MANLHDTLASQEEQVAFLQHPKKTTRKGGQRPGSLNERLAAKVTLLTDRLYERRKSLLESAGESFMGEDISFEERKKQFRTLKTSPALMLKSLASSSVIGSDGRLRISNKMLDALVELSDGRS